jgi:hypothetical protein
MVLKCESPAQIISKLQDVFRNNFSEIPTRIDREGNYYQVQTQNTNVVFEKEFWNFLKQCGLRMTGVGYTNKKGIIIHLSK